MTGHLFVGGSKIFSHHCIWASWNNFGKQRGAIILNHLSKITEEVSGGAGLEPTPALYLSALSLPSV